jgi:transposase
MRRRSDARTLESSVLRRHVVQAARGGMLQTDAARTFGANFPAVSMLRRLEREGGLRAPNPRGRPPREGRLSGNRAARIHSMIVGKVPDQLIAAVG